MAIPSFPEFAPLELGMKSEMHPRLSLTEDGVSEFTFSGLYLFRNRYGYRVSRSGPNGGFIISGEQPSGGHGGAPGEGGGARFFMTPCEAPQRAVLEKLFADHDYWKNISDAVLSGARQSLEDLGVAAEEDRDNFDYLYARSDLAELAGKKFHKKRNLVHQFVGAYSHESRPLTEETAPVALEILRQWLADRAPVMGDAGDYHAAKEALELFGELALRGRVFYADGKPAGYCLGESVAKGRMFAIHFEKGLDGVKGIYQYMNKEFAASLPRFFAQINREQDLGDEGLRQAKMTYRPCGFVRKLFARPGKETA
jgi:hypothetical protein